MSEVKVYPELFLSKHRKEREEDIIIKKTDGWRGGRKRTTQPPEEMKTD